MEVIEGVVLKKINYKEHSKIIYLYTNKGLISVLIHGSNKIKSPYLSLGELLSHLKVNISGKSLKTLRDGEVLNDYRETKEDIIKYTYCTHLLEIIYYFSSHEHDHEKLFNFLVKIINRIDESEDYIPYIYMLELKLLYLLGVNPEFKTCVTCNRTDGLQFSVKAGGMCCIDHFEGKTRFDKGTVEALKILYYYDLQNPVKLDINNETIINLRKLIDAYYEYHLNYRSNSRKILIGLIGY